MLWPARQGLYSGVVALDFVRDVLPSLSPEFQPLNVLQQAGDCIFLPPHWAHGVVNVQTSVGLGWEFAEQYITTWAPN